MSIKYEFLGYPENFDHNPIEDLILKYVKHGPVLDIGCGNGNLLVLLKDRFDVEGFDISEIAVDLAKKKGLKAKVADIETFKPKKKFKTILLIGLLVMAKNPKEYLKIAKSWLSPGGVIMITIPNATSPKNLSRFFRPKNKHHNYYPGFFEFQNFLRKNGFEIIKHTGAGKLKRFPILSSVVFYIIRPKDFT